jgi:hypothetical protein
MGASLCASIRRVQVRLVFTTSRRPALASVVLRRPTRGRFVGDTLCWTTRCHVAKTGCVAPVVSVSGDRRCSELLLPKIHTRFR